MYNKTTKKRKQNVNYQKYTKKCSEKALTIL